MVISNNLFDMYHIVYDTVFVLTWSNTSDWWSINFDEICINTITGTYIQYLSTLDNSHHIHMN